MNWKTPFINDMFCIVYQAFKNLYPDKECNCEWVPNLQDDDGNNVWGVTNFYDGEEIPYIQVSSLLKVCDAIEILAHELAHVAVGEYENHGKKWVKAFDAIHEEFDRLGNELFPNCAETVEVMDTKECVREAEFPIEKDGEYYCARCGNKLDEEWTHCPKCGQKVSIR